MIDVDSDEELPLFIPAYLNNVPNRTTVTTRPADGGADECARPHLVAGPATCYQPEEPAAPASGSGIGTAARVGLFRLPHCGC